jgi:diguanylate cyclase (GGDEF)-like protein
MFDASASPLAASAAHGEARRIGALAELRARTEALYRVPRTGAPAPDAARLPQDEVAVLGIPPDQLTPAVTTALAGLMAEIKTLRSGQALLQQRLREAEGLADVDPLSQTLNRRGFLRAMQSSMALAARTGMPTSVVFFDLNGFKQINDRHGHKAGDALLQAVAATLQGQVRGSDSVGRLGGDEFAVLLANAGPEEARRKGASLAAAIARTSVPWGRDALSVTAATGTHTASPGQTPDQVLARADEAMYSDKSARRVASL